MVNFNTRSIKLPEENQYIAKFIFEYPGHVSVASLLLNHKGTGRRRSIDDKQRTRKQKDEQTESPGKLQDQQNVHATNFS